jgi:hypothetical protein
MLAIYKDNNRLSTINPKFLIKARNFKKAEVLKYVNKSRCNGVMELRSDGVL